MKIHLILGYIIFFCLALISKLDAIGLVFYAPFIYFLFTTKELKLKNINFSKIAVSYLLPLFVLIIGRFILSNRVPIIEQEGLATSIVRYSENPIVSNWLLPNRIEALFSSFLLYFKMLVVPKGYYYYFGYDVIDFPLPWTILWSSVIILIALLYLFISQFKKNKLLCFGILFLIGNLLYCVNFATPVAGIVAARYAFIASIGFCILIAILLERLSNRYLQIGSLVILLSIYGYFSFDRTSDWKNLESLIEADLPYLQESHEAQRIAANVYLEIADTTVSDDKKLLYLEKAVNAFTNANQVYSENYVTHIQKGIALFKLNDYTASIESLQEGISLDTSFNAVSYEILGDAYFLNEHFNDAKSTYQLIAKEQPNNQDIIYKISSCYYEAGDYLGTIEYNDSIIKVSPRMYAPYENLAYFYWLQNDSLKAYNYLEEALKRSPNQTHKNETATSFEIFVNEN